MKSEGIFRGPEIELGAHGGWGRFALVRQGPGHVGGGWSRKVSALGLVGLPPTREE